MAKAPAKGSPPSPSATRMSDEAFRRGQAINETLLAIEAGAGRQMGLNPTQRLEAGDTARQHAWDALSQEDRDLALAAREEAQVRAEEASIERKGGLGSARRQQIAEERVHTRIEAAMAREPQASQAEQRPVDPAAAATARANEVWQHESAADHAELVSRLLANAALSADEIRKVLDELPARPADAELMAMIRSTNPNLGTSGGGTGGANGGKPGGDASAAAAGWSKGYARINKQLGRKAR